MAAKGGVRGGNSPTAVQAEQVLLLASSNGLGGGIERYVRTVEQAFSEENIPYRRLDLRRSGLTAHGQLIAEGRSALRESGPARLIVAHRSLLPVAAVLGRLTSVGGISVLCYGIDVWGVQRGVRRRVEARLMRSPRTRVVAISNFTAGALFRDHPAVILPPGLSADWFRTLAESAAVSRDRGQAHIRVLTAFRLAEWRGKGLPELLEAICMLHRPDIQLTVCGSGAPPAELREAVARHPWCTLMTGLTDQELAEQYAAASLFVLATRTRSGPHPSGEGFGLVLLEAQVAGTPVVGPAHGGSHDAYLDGVTGLSPLDESPGALAETLRHLVDDPLRLEKMGKHAAEWAREYFDPLRYAQLAVTKLL